MNYSLLGYPLSQSKSRMIHTKLFEFSGVHATYILSEYSDIETALRNELSYLDGFNVTIPFKRKIISHLDNLTPEAKRYGAVNTVKRMGGRLTRPYYTKYIRHVGGTLLGHNTDAEGFLLAASKLSALDGEILLLGAGGAARTVCAVCEERGARIDVAVRDVNSENAIALAKDFCADVIPIDAVNRGYQLIINATPTGMHPFADALPVPEEIIAASGAVFDLVAKPSPTKLVRVAREHGVPAEDGAEMLVRQAAAAHKFWYCASFAEEDIISLVDRVRGAK